MAIEQIISPVPQWMHRDEVKIFPTDQNLFVETNEAVYDHLSQVLAEQLNAFRSQTNTTQSQIEQSEANTKAYQDTSKTYSDESLVNKNLSLSYKTATELAYNNTQTLLSTLVIPTTATYSYSGADAKFAYKTDSFLKFNIGE